VSRTLPGYKSFSRSLFPEEISFPLVGDPTDMDEADAFPDGGEDDGIGVFDGES
jgi:hypothetical protein